MIEVNPLWANDRAAKQLRMLDKYRDSLDKNSSSREESNERIPEGEKSLFLRIE